MALMYSLHQLVLIQDVVIHYHSTIAIPLAPLFRAARTLLSNDSRCCWKTSRLPKETTLNKFCGITPYRNALYGWNSHHVCSVEWMRPTHVHVYGIEVDRLNKIVLHQDYTSPCVWLKMKLLWHVLRNRLIDGRFSSWMNKNKAESW